MRWQHKPWPRDGDLRTRRKFLLWPKRIDMESRWLEIAEWEERYASEPFVGTGGGYDLWRAYEWLD